MILAVFWGCSDFSQSHFCYLHRFCPVYHRRMRIDLPRHSGSNRYKKRYLDTWFLDILKSIYGYPKIHWFLDILKSNYGYPKSNYGYPKFSMIFGYPEMYFWISLNTLIFGYPKMNYGYPKIKLWISKNQIMDIQNSVWFLDIQKCILGYPKIHWFLDIQKWIMDIQKWITAIQNSAWVIGKVNYGYPKIDLWIS